MSEVVRCARLWCHVHDTSGMEQYTACFSKCLPATPDDPCSPRHRAEALGKHAPMQLRRELLHKEGPLGFLALLSPCCLGGASCQRSGWVGCARLLSGSLLFARVNSPQKVMGNSPSMCSQGCLLLALGKALITAATFPWLLSLFPFSSSSSFPLLNWGRGEGKRLSLISVEERSLFCSGFWLTQQTVFKI